MFDKGIGRFEEEAPFATEDVVIYVESSANGGRKRPLNLKKSAGFQPYIVSYIFDYIRDFFVDFWSFSVLPNVTAPL